MICLFVCVEFIVPLENFSLIWRRHHCRWRATYFGLCSALMAIEQWGFFYVPHLLWRGTSVYNGHLRGPVSLTPIVDRLAVELSLHVLRLRSFAVGILTSNLPLAKMFNINNTKEEHFILSDISEIIWNPATLCTCYVFKEFFS